MIIMFVGWRTYRNIGCHLFCLGTYLVWDSAVGIVTGYGLDGRGVGVRVPVGGKIFPLSTSSRQALGPTQSPIQ
jgi:hypothetical protein